MNTLLPPVSREQAFLETYFQCLSQLAYDKAKESCEKESYTQKLNSSTLWGQMVNGLVQLAMAEKTYASLMFLGLKWFGRKDTLRSSYEVLLRELKKMEDTPSKHEVGSSETSLDKILSHLSGQLGHFLTARAKLMDFYEQMATLGSSNKCLNCEDLLIVISDIISSYQKNFHHPILSPLKSSFTYRLPPANKVAERLECDIVNHLLQAQLQMSHWQFLPSLLHLNDARTKLTSLSTIAPVKESKKLTFGSKQPPLPALHQWLNKFKGHLVSKFSLYFYDVLSKQAPPGEMKALLSKAIFDFCGKIVTFQKKSDAVCVCLVFDSNKLPDFQKGSGYHHPQKFTEPPQGMDSYPAIFLYPPEKPDRHWRNVISIISERFSAADHPLYEKSLYFCDETLPGTYFMMPVEPRITFVLIFEAKKSEKDSYINTFITDMSAQMRCSKLFAALRPGTKG